MTAIQMNIRIDERTKLTGDSILARFAMTPSSFVRMAYEKLVNNESLTWLEETPSNTSPQTSASDTPIMDDDSWQSYKGFALQLANAEGINLSEVTNQDEFDLDDLKAEAYFERASERGLL